MYNSKRIDASMRLCAIVPVKRLDKSKSRLAEVLSNEERVMLSVAMLKDILATLSCKYISGVFVITSDDTVKEIAYSYKAVVIQDKDRGVNHAVSLANDHVKGYDASVVLPHDIPLINNLDVAMLYNSALYSKECVVITPSHRFDGTNALLRRNPFIINTHYDEDSYTLHIKEAIEKGVRIKILLCRGLMYDIDEVDDLYTIAGIIAESNNNKKKKKDMYTKELLERLLKR